VDLTIPDDLDKLVSFLREIAQTDVTAGAVTVEAGRPTWNFSWLEADAGILEPLCVHVEANRRGAILFSFSQPTAPRDRYRSSTSTLLYPLAPQASVGHARAVLDAGRKSYLQSRERPAPPSPRSTA
jgi:hypothetical protein